MMPKSAATQALLFGRDGYNRDGYGKKDLEENDDDDENVSARKNLFSKSNNFGR